MKLCLCAVALLVALTPVRAQDDLAALQTMQDTLGPMVEAASERVAKMKQYIADHDLESDWEDFTPPPAAKITHLTFDQALQIAERHQRLLVTAPKGVTPGAMKSLVESQWNHLGTLHQQVADLTAFLESERKLEAYRQWAMSDVQPQAPANQETNEQRELNAQQIAQQRYNQHLAEYREQLDQEQQSQQNSNDDPSDDANYYDGSYWNGYADPYYDVYPEPVIVPRYPHHVPGPYWWHDQPHPWNRSNGRLYTGHGAVEPRRR